MWVRLKHNWGQKLFAFISAVLLWIYVHTQENPLITQELKKEIEVNGLAPGFVITSHLPTVSITLRGAKRKLERISSNAIKAEINLEGKGVGTYNLPVRISAPKGLDISYRPRRVKVVIDGIVSQQMAVQPVISSQPPEGFSLRAISINPPNVLVYYPLSKKDEMAGASVLVDLEKGEGDSMLPVLVMDRRNKPMQNVRVVPPLVKVSIRFNVPRAGKVLVVVPDLVGSLPNNLVLEKVEVNPQTVAVTGPNTILEKLSTIKTEKIDLSRISASCSLEVPLVKLEGVNILDRGSVTVKLTIGGGSNG
jgi:YbbR domain-containing protein